ncbi:MAG: hypothetical protein AAF915_06680 [Cyanobacteria bacterium P01_D01_bin.50]
MMIAIPIYEWEIFQTFSKYEIVQLLKQLSTGVNLKQFLKATRGAKKPKLPIIYDSKKGHISTKRLLQNYNHS